MVWLYCNMKSSIPWYGWNFSFLHRSIRDGSFPIEKASPSSGFAPRLSVAQEADQQGQDLTSWFLQENNYWQSKNGKKKNEIKLINRNQYCNCVCFNWILFNIPKPELLVIFLVLKYLEKLYFFSFFSLPSEQRRQRRHQS